jgi:hypothetical protein
LGASKIVQQFSLGLVDTSAPAATLMLEVTIILPAERAAEATGFATAWNDAQKARLQQTLKN